MSIFTSLLTRVRSYVGPRTLSTGVEPRDGFDRQVSVIPYSQTRWTFADLEAAIRSADTGLMRAPGRLCRAMRRDGQIAGVLSTRTEGLVQLPVRFAGPDSELVSALSRVFRAIFASSELALLSGDGRTLGVGVGEFVQIPGSLLAFKRLDPEFLQYRWAEDRWYYQSTRGIEPVNPGDGRWILHCPGGAVQPWTHGLWAPLGRAFISKEHAFYQREGYANTLANPARIATAPLGSSDPQKLSFMSQALGWTANAVYVLTAGWDFKLLEPNGRGYEVWQDIIKTSNEEITICLAGQSVSTDGGKAFTSSAIHEKIRSDLIQADADALALTLNEQAIPVWANEMFGAGAVELAPHVWWDVTRPPDLAAEAQAGTQAAASAKAFDELLANEKRAVDVVELARRYGVPTRDVVQEAA